MSKMIGSCVGVVLFAMGCGADDADPNASADAAQAASVVDRDDVDPPTDQGDTGSDAHDRRLPSTAKTGERAAAVVTEIPVALTAGQTVVFQTTSLSTGADPIMSLLSPAGVDVKSDNDGASSGKNALIVYTPTTTGTYRLVVRAANSLSGGTCSVARNGTPTWFGVSFSGGPTRVGSLVAGESLETVKLAGGATGTHAIYVLNGDLVGIERRVVGGGTSGAARVSFSTTLGTHYVVYAVRAASDAGMLGWVRNDAGIASHDADGDGLGNDLEAAIGTCSLPSGTVVGPDGEEFDCAQAPDPRDTDGDGISDAWELVGRRDVSPHQPLPLWGADPRHKDLFLEVDFMQKCTGDMDQQMPAATARRLAAIYGDQLEPLSPLVALAHATLLRNPDRKPGISMHIDSGLAPSTNDDVTLFGNWGGHNIVAPANGSTCTGQDAASAWTTQMSTARRGIFHYVLAFVGGGASNVEYRVYSAWPFDNASLGAHELGHSLGFGHSGHAGNNGDTDVNCKPNYPSLMNYAYLDRATTANVGFSDALTRGALDNLSVREQAFTTDTRYLTHLRDVFDYNVDLAAGHVDWNRDGYFSSTNVQAYTNFHPGGQGCEWTRYNGVTVGAASAMGTAALAHLGNRSYVLYTDASTGQLARAYTTRSASMTSNLACPRVGDCSGVTFSTPVTRPLDASSGVDAIRLSVNGVDTVLVVTIDAAGRLWETRLTLSGAAEVWTTPAPIGTTVAAGEPSLAADGQFSARLVFKGADGRIRTNRFAVGGWQGESLAQTLSGVPAGQPPQALPVMAATASPAVAFTYMPGFTGRHTFGAFADASGAVDLWRLNLETNLWEKTNVLDGTRPVVRRKPSMAWAWHGSENLGIFYLGYVAAGSGATGEPKFLRSYATLLGGVRVEHVGMDSPFDNNSASFASIAFSYDGSEDINLRGVVVTGSGAVLLRPNADGITGYSQRNIDDLQWLSVTLCRTLIYPTNGRGTTPDSTLTNPIHCLPFQYVPN